MVSVCRFCARWAEDVVGVDEILLENLPHAKDAVKQLFDFDMSCDPSFPNKVCPECVLFLQSCYFFRDQLRDAEYVFQTLQERGVLAQRLSTQKNAGDALHLEEVIEGESHSELRQGDAQENVESVDGNADGESLVHEMDPAVGDTDAAVGEIDTAVVEMDAAVGEEMAAEPSERIIEISIEAIEELEITSTPLESYTAIRTPSERLNTFVNENQTSAVAEPRPNNSVMQERVNVSRRQPMVEAVPPGQRANGAVVRNICYVCYAMYRTEAELMAHLIEHNDLLPYRCQMCSTEDLSIVFGTNQAMNKHLESHCNPFECAKCHRRFSTRSKLEEHIRLHLNRHLYACKRCGISFHELRKFRLHMADHRNMDIGRYQTANRATERQRIVQHHSSGMYLQCPHCDCGFKYHANYKMHLKHHQQTKYLFRCTEIWCDANFTTYRKWRRHMNLHFPNESVPFMFEILPKSLQDATIYPLACPEPDCAYVAPALPQMYSHFYIHVRWLQCWYCEKVYKNVSALRFHVQQCHGGARLLAC